jgi:hypothetical protein
MVSALALTWGALLCAQAAAQEQKPVRLFAEAEDFTVEKGRWAVMPYRENYFASTFAVTFLSRMGCLAAPEQVPAGEPAVATQEVTLPCAADYEILVRYEQPYNFSCEFTIEIVQQNQVKARVACGRLEDPKIWAFSKQQRLPMARFWWGGTDNIVWQNPGTVKLEPGPATIRLVADVQLEGKQPRLNAARRHVDVVCLTNDREGLERLKPSPTARTRFDYLELDGWLVQDGDLYVRVTNPKDATQPCIPVIEPNNGGQHSPYYVHTRDWAGSCILKSGRWAPETGYINAGPRSSQVSPQDLAPQVDRSKLPATPDTRRKAKTPAFPPGEYLQPGDVSGWVPMGHVLDALNNSVWVPRAEYAVKGTPLYLQFEFAVPDGKGGLKPVKDVTVRGDPAVKGGPAFEIPGNVHPNRAMAGILKERWWLPEIRTRDEALAWLTAEVARFPAREGPAKRFLLYGIIGQDETGEAATRLGAALGNNTAAAQGGKTEMIRHWPDPSDEGIAKRVASRAGGLTNVHIVSYGDEMHLPAAKPTDEEFAEWLKARGVALPGAALYTTNRDDALYYYSQTCAKEKGGQRYVKGTAYYAGHGILTGANYSPHANYLVTDIDYVRPFKMKALSLAWSEDYVWQVPEFSVQAVGYLVTAFRCGVKYHHQPILMYTMPHSPGNTPRDFRLAFYTAVAHGSTIANFYCAIPLCLGSTENYVATDDLPMWRAIYDAAHDAAVFEDYVMDGRVRQAKVGLLLSGVDDILSGARNNGLALHNNERKAIYYALRHAQVPVDMITEDDVIDGLAKDYQVIYVTQRAMHSKACGALQRWVEAGGTLVALCGGGFTDEFQRANPEINALYGIKDQQLTVDPNLVSRYLMKTNVPFLSKQDLPLYKPVDQATWQAGAVTQSAPVIVWKQVLTPSDGRVIGRFQGGEAAVVEKTHGKGKAVLFGFLPGQAYLKSGLPVRPADRSSVDSGFNHFLPTDMDPSLRAALVHAWLPPDFSAPVTCGEPLVETTCIDTASVAGRPARLAVPLLNYTGKALRRVTVTVRGLTSASKVRSMAAGELKAVPGPDSLTVELPLDVADMLLIDR